MCVCVCEKEREGEGERELGVCVCVCVCEICVCECVCVCVSPAPAMRRTCSRPEAAIALPSPRANLECGGESRGASDRAFDLRVPHLPAPRRNLALDAGLREEGRELPALLQPNG